MIKTIVCRHDYEPCYFNSIRECNKGGVMMRFGILGVSLWCLTIGAMESTNEPVMLAASIKAVLALAKKKFQTCTKQEQDGAKLRALIDDAISTTIKDKYPISILHTMIAREVGGNRPDHIIRCDKEVRAIDVNSAGTHILAGVDRQVRLFFKDKGTWRADEYNHIDHASQVTALYFGGGNRFVSTNARGYVCIYTYDDWDIKQDTAFQLPDDKTADIITIDDTGDRIAACSINENGKNIMRLYKRNVAHWDLGDEVSLPMEPAGLQWTAQGALIAYGASLNIKNNKDGIITQFGRAEGLWFPAKQQLFKWDEVLDVLVAYGSDKHQDSDTAFSMVSGTHVKMSGHEIAIGIMDSYIQCTDAIAQRGWE